MTQTVDVIGAASTSLNWTAEDQRAVDTVRVLAADAVEKVGNGHPGTAMSLAPAAYLERALWMEADRMGFLLDAMTQERLSNQVSVGFLGLGQMGAPMAERLIAPDIRLHVFDPRPEAVAAVTRRPPLESPR